jgi:hypothetical protein
MPVPAGRGELPLSLRSVEADPGCESAGDGLPLLSPPVVDRSVSEGVGVGWGGGEAKGVLEVTDCERCRIDDSDAFRLRSELLWLLDARCPGVWLRIGRALSSASSRSWYLPSDVGEVMEIF